MAYVQNINRDAKLKSGPLADYSAQAQEAKEKDRKNNEEALRRRIEQDRTMRGQKAREAENLQRIELYKRRKRERLNKAVGRSYGNLFRSRQNAQLSGTMKAQIGRHEGASTAKA